MNTQRIKLWQDRTFAEMWKWNGSNVLRFRALNSYPWKYCIGEFTTDHCPYAVRRDRPMTQDEINAFKKARSISPGLHEAKVQDQLVQVDTFQTIGQPCWEGRR